MPAKVAEAALVGVPGHVHGAVAQRDGTVLLGTHGGLVSVRSDDGRAVLVGSGRDDLMGFTGDDATLYTSGHPAPDNPAADPMGLRRSDDGGMTWADVSLQGQVDFHALAVQGSRLLGWTSRDLMLASGDGGSTWTQVGELRPANLTAMDQQVYATTAAGLVVSADWGGTWTPVPGAPLLRLVTSDGSRLWGIDVSGVVWRAEPGRPWSKGPTVGLPQAITAAAGVAYVVTETALVTVK